MTSSRRVSDGTHCRPPHILGGLVLALMAAWSSMAASAVADEVGFERDSLAFIQRYCVDCHTEASPEGKVNLEQFTTEDLARKDQRTWQRVLLAVREHHMPPTDSEQPDPTSRERFLRWVGAAARGADCDGPVPVQPVVMRRLTRDEYQNSLVDLLGVAHDYRDRFPADGAGGEGFDTNAETLFIPPVLLERYLAVAREALDEAFAAEDLNRIVTQRPGRDRPARTAAREVIGRFAQRAFRRPVEVEEVDRLMLLYDRAASRGEGYVDSLRLPLLGVLCSPHFLFRLEAPNKDAGAAAYEISRYELATRLSYFLWGGPPDDELYRLAEDETLSQRAVLEQQVARMLADAKARRFATSFTEQWLKLRDLGSTVGPDPDRFPEFTEALAADCKTEAVLLVEHVFRENRPLGELIDCDYTFVNERLAQHYGLAGVEGEAFRQVRFNDRRRGGVLTMAGPLTLASYPQRTSPVLRGVWVLEQILGAPTPPPPPDVPELEEGEQVAGRSLREQLAAHREQATCAGCHQRIDPLGFALEAFDPIGRWRDRVAGEPVDDRAELPDGTEFSGPEGLKQVLNQRREEFARTFTERLLAYALGRGIENDDFCLVERLMDAGRDSDFAAQRLIVEIVDSPVFRQRRNP